VLGQQTPQCLAAHERSIAIGDQDRAGGVGSIPRDRRTSDTHSVTRAELLRLDDVVEVGVRRLPGDGGAHGVGLVADDDNEPAKVVAPIVAGVFRGRWRGWVWCDCRSGADGMLEHCAASDGMRHLWQV
jgi:hypothetical protein